MRGLPDWGRPVNAGPDGLAWAAFQDDRYRLVLPDALVLDRDGWGRPDFHLAAFRPAIPTPLWRGYARLDMSLRLSARAATADGVLRSLPPRRGWLRLSSEGLDLPQAMTEPAALRCSGTGLIHLMLPLPPEGFGRVEMALKDGAVPILAMADLEMAGVAPTAAGRAIIDVARLRAALAPGMASDSFASAVLQDPSALGIELDGAPEAVSVAADHIRARLCAPEMRPGATGLDLVWADSGMASGRVVLDLSQPVLASRALRLTLDPFAMARDLANGPGGLDALITRTTSGILTSGQHSMMIDANLPRPIVGPLALGATLSFAPHPPERTHRIAEEVELPADGESLQRIIRLAPTEALDWTVQGFAYVPTADGRGVLRLDGREKPGAGPRVALQPDDFPLTFVQVEAAPAVLDRGEVDLVMTGGGQTARASLTANQPRLALAVPGPDAELQVKARSYGGKIIDLGPRPPIDARIELSDLPGFGARVLQVTLALPAGVALRAIDLMAEDAAADSAVQTFAFTPARPTREVHWFCADPFRPGLRWRWHSPTGALPFSDPVSGPVLHIDAREGAPA